MHARRGEQYITNIAASISLHRPLLLLLLPPCDWLLVLFIRMVGVELRRLGWSRPAQSSQPQGPGAMRAVMQYIYNLILVLICQAANRRGTAGKKANAEHGLG